MTAQQPTAAEVSDAIDVIVAAARRLPDGPTTDELAASLAEWCLDVPEGGGQRFYTLDAAAHGGRARYELTLFLAPADKHPRRNGTAGTVKTRPSATLRGAFERALVIAGQVLR